MAKSNEPIWWSLFSAGGVVAALLVPVHIVLFGIAGPLGMLPADALEFSRMQALLANPLVRHGAAMLIAVLCYGAAIAGTIVAALTLWG